MRLKLLCLFLVSNSITSVAQEKKYDRQSYDVAPTATWINENKANQFYISSIFNNQKGGFGVIMSTNTGFKNQVKCTATNKSLNDSIQKYLNKGFYISDVAGGKNNDWSILLSSAENKQKHVTIEDDSLPKQNIRNAWMAGFKITAITSNETKWLVVMSTSDDISLQDIHSERNIPREYIKDYWDKGYSITNVHYSKGFWTVVMSKTKSILLQAYETDTSFPTDWIRKKWNTGYRITSVSKNGYWFVVMSKFR